jgi:hypothetical protein
MPDGVLSAVDTVRCIWSSTVKFTLWITLSVPDRAVSAAPSVQTLTSAFPVAVGVDNTSVALSLSWAVAGVWNRLVISLGANWVTGDVGHTVGVLVLPLWLTDAATTGVAVCVLNTLVTVSLSWSVTSVTGSCAFTEVELTFMAVPVGLTLTPGSDILGVVNTALTVSSVWAVTSVLTEMVAYTGVVATGIAGQEVAWISPCWITPVWVTGTDSVNRSMGMLAT